MIDAGRGAFPVVIEGTETHRLWAAALFCRTLDGYDAVLLLHESGLDAEARAHSRIAFEHLLGFAWVVARPRDAKRPLRIAHHGTGFVERRMAELAGYGELSAPSFVTSVDAEGLEPPPATPDICRELDRELTPRVKGFACRNGRFVQRLVLVLLPGGSAFVHPSPAGIEDLFEQVSDGVKVAPSRKSLDDVIGLTLDQLTAAEAIARVAPWLLDPGRA